jgi:hypothetical protein
MSDTPFTSFGRFSRPDIGLISDSTQNLAEIFDSDKRDALRNILIRPEILDSLYGVSEDITREDLRSASGLSRLLLPSLNQLNEMTNDRVPTRLYINKEFYSPDSTLGGIGSPTLNTPNVILFNGSVQCEGVQYRANTIGTTLFTNPNRVNVPLSTSRASLFNSETDPVNVGYFLSARYPGSIRVRRRSHVNRIFVPKTSFLTKSSVLENPTHSIQVNVDNGNTGTITPVKLLATKNTPLRVYCRMAVGSIKFTFTDSAAPYFFGYQIQPAQQRPNSPPIDFLPVTESSQKSGSQTFTLNIDITTTGYQNLYDLYLYLYVNPEKVSGIEFSGIDIREFPDRKDLGMIGFNNLQDFKVSEGSMTILPLWLKTLRTTLRSLDLSSSGDTWRSGPMGWFDIRDASATPSFTHPLYTSVSYLTIPRSGALINEDGNDWSGSSGSGGSRVSGLFEKYIRNLSRIAGTDYRQFTSLTSLSLGDRFLGRSPRFDDVFPNLRELSWGRGSDSRNYRFLFGSLPKINNNGSIITYNIAGSGATGSIVDIGTSTTPTDTGHISKYKMSGFTVNGFFNIRNNISGYINNPSENWSNWLTTTTSINYTYSGSGLSINLQSGTWENLVSLSAAFSGGAQLSNPSQPLLTPKLRSLSLYGSGTTGQMFGLGSVSNTSALEEVDIGSCSSISAIVSNGINYLLPSNFANSRSPGNDHKLTALSIAYFTPLYRFRNRDLENLYNLTYLNTVSSNLTGKFPLFPLRRLFETDTKSISILSENSRFYDLRNLNINQSNFYFSRDIRTIVIWGQNSPNGGALLPSFEGTSTSNIQTVDMNGSQPSTYRSDWSVVNRRDSCVLDTDAATTVSGLSISRSIQTDPDDNVYTLTGSSNFRQLVQVGDVVRASSNGSELARVMSVSDNSVIIDSDIPDPLPTSLHFVRRTNDISNWFGAGFTSLLVFRANNCKLSGTLNIRSGFSQIRDDSYTALDLSRNSISGYVNGGLSRIFSGNSRRITVDLSSNNLSAETIRSIISEIADLDSLRRFSNCRVRLSLNKLDSNNKYSNYTQNEIFPVTVISGSSIVTSLSRNETFKVFTETTITNPDGSETIQRVQTGTRTVNIPGALVNGIYYKTKTDNTQVTQENSVALRFKNLRGILIDLGFTYVSPSTIPVVTSTVYGSVTTRNQSIIDAGENPANLVNP